MLTITNIKRGRGGEIHAELRRANGELVIAATLDYIQIRLEEMLPPAPKPTSECVEWVKKYRNDNGCTLKEAKYEWDILHPAVAPMHETGA